MRSLIIIEVEHGEDTDALQHYFEHMVSHADNVQWPDFAVLNSTVKVDLPECFVLDS